MSQPIYDSIGESYADQRRVEPAIMKALAAALGGARSVVNVGAGAGSYEPTSAEVVAVEPSRTMIGQRAAGSAPAVCAWAEALPFPDRSFDAGLAILTVHHWTDLARGLAEMVRVARDRIVLLTWDPEHPGFWLTQDYFPDIRALDSIAFPPLSELTRYLGGGRSEVLRVPHGCRDGFLGAYWGRPASYLDPAVRAGMSTFSRIEDVEPRLERLSADLASGRWRDRHGHLEALSELDVGYRIVTLAVADQRGRP
jgi:SAM-dependent methyltransferase